MLRLLVVTAVVCAVASAKWKVRTPGAYETYDWNSYKAAYNKTYLTGVEEGYRRSLYLAEVGRVNRFNAEYDRGLHTWWKGINQFSDMTQDEIENSQGLILPADIKERENRGTKKVTQTTAPAVIDWRSQGAVTPVKDQGMCGSCWAFAAVASLEGRHAIKNGDLPNASEQQVVSCSQATGCQGGWYDNAWKYVHEQGSNGVDTTASYPYVARDAVTAPCETAKTQDNKDVAATCEGPGYTEKNEASVMQSVGNDGPLAVAMSCYLWASYSGGIFEDPKCTAKVSHAVTIVGYDDNEKFWIIKNSWKESWGDHGYIRMRKDFAALEFGMCGIAQHAYYPLV